MELRKIGETPTTITFGWKPVACEGYLFFADGKRVSKTFDPTRSSIKFSKGPKSFRIEAINFVTIDSDVWPDPVSQPPPVQKMAAPQTINPEGGSDARYCVRDLPTEPNSDIHYEPSDPAIRYDSDGLCLGGRTKDRVIPGLRGARSVDGADYCGYSYNDKSYPPWPEESYLK